MKLTEASRQFLPSYLGLCRLYFSAALQMKPDSHFFGRSDLLVPVIGAAAALQRPNETGGVAWTWAAGRACTAADLHAS